MSKINLTIDGKKVTAAEGMTLLEAASSVGIEIPALCHHEKLAPFGGCRLCMVELDMGSWTKLVVSCVYTVEKDLVVTTRSEKLNRIRKNILELLLALYFAGVEVFVLWNGLAWATPFVLLFLFGYLYVGVLSAGLPFPRLRRSG